MKRLLTALLLIASSATCLLAQSRDGETFDEWKERVTGGFTTYVDSLKTDFERYRERLNAEYAATLGGQWSAYKQQPQTPAPIGPKPDKPEENSPSAAPGVIVPAKVVAPEKKIPDIPVTLPKPTREKKSYPVNFTFFNTPCGLRRFDTSLLSLKGVDNASVSKAWKRITDGGATEALIEDCLRLREELNLCDWGYLTLIEKVAQTLYPNNEDYQNFLAVVLLNQCGYDCRFCKYNGRLRMMFHPSHTIYSRPFWNIDGKRYYINIPSISANATLESYPGDYHKNPTPIRMVMDRYPRFNTAKSGQRPYSSKFWTKAPPIEFTVNPSVIKFLDTYPQVDWHLYGLSPLSDELQSTLFVAFDILTNGMGPVEAVNLILSFHNNAFAYQTDGDQFGREKPFFFDENFYYPFNDCEDRAILFARLVNQVLGLDVVYLQYPRHLCAAVKFPPGVSIKGTTVTVDGEKYYVCEPTTSKARVGQVAREYINSKPIVHKIKL